MRFLDKLVVYLASHNAANRRGESGTIGREITYPKARFLRTHHGHAAAQGMYKNLLDINPKDLSAATRIAASCETPFRHDRACSFDPSRISKLRLILQTSNYTNAAVQEALRFPRAFRSARCPVYVKPCDAGCKEFPPAPDSPLLCLIALFLLGVCVPEQIVIEQLGPSFSELTSKLGIAFVEDNVLIPYVHIFPLQLSNDEQLWLVTDLHPRVLSATTVGSNFDNAVMYIGPDSLALVQHFRPTATYNRVVDICTGSGIQALCTKCHAAICVDINPRALVFTRFNAALNEQSDKIRVLKGDVTADKYEEVITEGTIDLILSNPPFIPVPDNNEQVLNRYGFFSSGGFDGQQVLAGVLALSSRLLKDGGMIAIVSEFMNPNSAELRIRLQEWCPQCGGVLLSNEYPIKAELYATRRADSRDELLLWKKHLEEIGVTEVSPGFLFLRQRTTGIQHIISPKTPAGSIWTPSNVDAIEFSKLVLAEKLNFSSI